MVVTCIGGGICGGGMLFAALKSQLPEKAGSEEKEEAELGVKPDADVSDQK